MRGGKEIAEIPLPPSQPKKDSFCAISLFLPTLSLPAQNVKIFNYFYDLLLLPLLFFSSREGIPLSQLSAYSKKKERQRERERNFLLIFAPLNAVSFSLLLLPFSLFPLQ